MPLVKSWRIVLTCKTTVDSLASGVLPIDIYPAQITISVKAPLKCPRSDKASDIPIPSNCHSSKNPFTLSANTFLFASSPATAAKFWDQVQPPSATPTLTPAVTFLLSLSHLRPISEDWFFPMIFS